MALPSSGAISFDNLRNEYGNGGSIALSEMYRGGSFVLNHSNNGNVPTSGTISLSNFYGQSNTAPNWSMTLTIGSPGGKLQEYGYGAVGFTQNQTPAYGSVSDNTVDILGGAFLRQCKWSSGGTTVFVEIDGGSTSWSSIVINGTTFNRTSMSKNTDAWSLGGQSNPFGTSGNITVTMNP